MADLLFWYAGKGVLESLLNAAVGSRYMATINSKVRLVTAATRRRRRGEAVVVANGTAGDFCLRELDYAMQRLLHNRWSRVRWRRQEKADGTFPNLS